MTLNITHVDNVFISKNAENAQTLRANAEELITIVAHDLRNYLTPLIGRISFVRKRAYKAARQRDIEDLDCIVAILDGMDQMIHNLLDVRHLEQGLFSITKEPVELVGLTQEIARVLSTSTNPIKVSADQKVYLSGDIQRLKQAVENLVSNALRYSPEGVPVKISVTTEYRKEEKLARLTVTDKGPGILPERVPFLFGCFAPGPDSTGLGLGLYLAHGIAAAHCGSLTVDSIPGEGTSFYLLLPVK